MTADSGDPATDLAVAWMLFGSEERELFRNEYGDVTGSTWDRAAAGLSRSPSRYFPTDNAEMGEIGRLTLENVLADREAIRAPE